MNYYLCMALVFLHLLLLQQTILGYHGQKAMQSFLTLLVCCESMCKLHAAEQNLEAPAPNKFTGSFNSEWALPRHA